MSIAMRYAARSDVGLVRSNNQDSGFAGPDLLVVAPGLYAHDSRVRRGVQDCLQGDRLTVITWDQPLPAELDPRAPAAAAVHPRVDALGDDLRPQPERGDRPPVDGQELLAEPRRGNHRQAV